MVLTFSNNLKEHLYRKFLCKVAGLKQISLIVLHRRSFERFFAFRKRIIQLSLKRYSYSQGVTCKKAKIMKGINLQSYDIYHKKLYDIIIKLF